jgi:hypothetical protein
MALGGQRHVPAALPPVKGPGTHWTEAGWAPGSVWTGAENLALIGIRSQEWCLESEIFWIDFNRENQNTRFMFSNSRGRGGGGGKNTHTMLIALARQQWSRERVSYVTYVRCLLCYIVMPVFLLLFLLSLLNLITILDRRYNSM